jgi:outer membrane protein OmpA-like peptidoglycan-associated protein
MRLMGNVAWAAAATPGRLGKPRFGLAFAVAAGAVIAFAGVGSTPAGAQPTEAQIIEALKAKRLTRCPHLDSGLGCGEAQVEKPSIDVEITFDFAAATLDAKAVSALVALAGMLGNPMLTEGRILVAGHSDAKGSASYNRRLSERRAGAVRRFLVEQFGLPAHKLVAVGFGKARLKNRSDPFAQENRRVQVVNMAAR